MQNSTLFSLEYTKIVFFGVQLWGSRRPYKTRDWLINNGAIYSLQKWFYFQGYPKHLEKVVVRLRKIAYIKKN